MALSLKRVRNIFGQVCLVSVVVFLFHGGWNYIRVAASSPTNPPPSHKIRSPILLELQLGKENSLFQSRISLYISIASLCTSTVTFLGFLITTTLALIKERRESKHSALDLEKKRLEIEKLKLEIESKRTKPDTQSRNEHE